jgi:hypothetical protein
MAARGAWMPPEMIVFLLIIALFMMQLWKASLHAYGGQWFR